jgi:biopolymer transport protein ExbD
MYINFLSYKSLFIDPRLFIFIIIYHFIMFETITYNNLKTLVHDLMTRLYDQYHQIWTWRIKIYNKDNKSKYDQLMKVMRTMKYKRKYKYDQFMKVMKIWNIKGNINTINSWKSWGHWNIKGNINAINFESHEDIKCKRKYKYDQLMKVMRALKYKSSLYYFLF